MTTQAIPLHSQLLDNTLPSVRRLPFFLGLAFAVVVLVVLVGSLRLLRLCRLPRLRLRLHLSDVREELEARLTLLDGLRQLQDVDLDRLKSG